MTRIALHFVIALLLASSFVAQAAAQKRDHLTPQEVDLVKEAQVLDKRIDVFIKAAERRLMVINGSANANEGLGTLGRTADRISR